MSGTIDTWLATHARHQAGKIALRCAGESWTYHDLDRWVQSLAAGLAQEHGIKRGDRLAFLGHNSAAEVALFFAAARLGAIMLPLNWRLSREELGYILDDAEARLLIFGPEMEELARALGPLIRAPFLTATDMPLAAGPPGPSAAPDDPFLLVYTSGTTGRPKGAVHTQSSVFWNALISLHAHDFTSQDHVLNILPLFHVGGINIQMMPIFYVGGTVTLHTGFDPSAVLSALRTEPITSTVCVPAVMQALMAHPSWHAARFPHMRLLNTGSTDVPVEILRAVNDRGLPMVQVYGATETGPVTCYQRAEEAGTTIGSIGRPGAHVQVRIAQADGTDCADDEPGEIWVKAPNCFSHYWRNPSATAQAVQDGWFKTGDIARRDADGLLWFVGRSKHVIISGGENIYPAEIERLLLPMPGIREVAVVGRQDPKWGEVPVVVAAIETGGPDKAQILDACAGIAKFKQPKDVVIIEALPRNALGKIAIEEVKALAIKPLR